METATAENAERPTISSIGEDHHVEAEDVPPNPSNHQDAEQKYDISNEEITSLMEVIAATGKFWHEWRMLKSLLSFRLKQVLAEYPESQVDSGAGSQQSSLSGETYQDLERRLDEALLSFIDGPPFTLQRLCEILLAPKSTYRSLSKLALALEKNLLVTSTLPICTEPYPTTEKEKTLVDGTGVEEHKDHSDLVPNGVEAIAGDGDEEMTEAEVDEDTNPTNDDAEMTEEKVGEKSESTSSPSARL